MRTFLASVALLLAAVLGTVALASYVAHQTVLAPANSGRVLASALEDPGVRHRLLAQTVPGYDSLPSAVRSGVDQVAQDPRFDAAVRRLRVSGDGTVQLAGLRRHLESQLRADGLPAAAAVLQQLGGRDSVRLPVPAMDRYASARSTTWRLATQGGAAAVVLLVLAVLVARNRRAALRGAGVVVLGCCAVTALLWWALPTLVRAVHESVWAGVAASARHDLTGTALGVLVPVAVAGVVLVLISLLLPTRRTAW